MAGIGIEFKSLQKKRSIFNTIRVIGYALALSVGPWLATTAAVGAIVAMQMAGGWEKNQVFVFTSLIMYIFAGSLILASPFFMIVSRYLADEHHLDRPDQRKAARFSQLLLLPFALTLGVGGALYYLPASLGTSILTQGMAVLLFVLLCESWVLLAYLEMEKQYAATLAAFSIGTVAAVLLAWRFKPLGWPENAVTGYAIGYFLTYLLLLFSALNSPRSLSHRQQQAGAGFQPRRFLSYFQNLFVLGLIGLLYNLGVWIDKFVLWSVTGSLVSGSRMMVYNPYDIATFAATLLMIPAVAYFLMVVETDFYDDYREFLHSLESASLSTIELKRIQLVETLRRHWNNLFELEVVVLVLGVLIGSYLLGHLGLKEPTIAIFQKLSLAVFFQVLFWINIILLLYFEFRWEACALSLFFCLSNGILTWLFHQWQLPHGWGYAASAAAGAIISWAVLRRGLKNLVRHCFYLTAPYSHTPTS